jgi:hypothetical protein
MDRDYEGERISAEARELVAEFLALQEKRQSMDKEHALCLQEHERNDLQHRRLVKLLDSFREQKDNDSLTAGDMEAVDQLLAEHAVINDKEERVLVYLNSLIEEHKHRSTRFQEIREQMEALMAEAVQKGCDVDLDFPELE